ncbi:NAD-dependent epimerase/dehydratase family protein [Bacteroidota bacterium]
MKIAIIGATSHIAKGLIYFLKEDRSIRFHLYARNLEKVTAFLKLIGYEDPVLKPFPEFKDDRVDLIINCIGISFLPDMKSLIGNVFELTEQFDHLILNNIENNRETTYINLSSGAVYGTTFHQPATENTKTIIDVNNIRTEDYYRIAKLNAEAKHRSLNYYNIIDLRIFGYYSRFIDLSKNYLMTDIISCIKEKRTLKTGADNIIRDFIHPSDLANIIVASCKNKKINQAIDVKSMKPISKMEILNYFQQKHGLKYEIIEDYEGCSPTGEKLSYYSENNNLEQLNHRPKYTSLECIEMETEAIFNIFS